jgi:polysaccharide deacetylase family protein (PEP-CTERM system associated)
MFAHRGYAGVALIAAVALNAGMLHSIVSDSVAVAVTFAAACLSLSWLLAPRRKVAETVPHARKPPKGTMESVSFRAATRESHTTAQVNAFTIDLEDYFHTEVASRAIEYSDWDRMPSRIERSVHCLLDLLDDHDTQATVFVLGWIARKYPSLIREVARRGHEIACHSFRHRLVNRMNPETFHEDTRMAKAILEDVTGLAINGYRAPSFSITPGTEWAFDILEQLGFTYDSSVNPIWHSTYANTRAPRFPYFIKGTRLLEIPIATMRVGRINLPVGGGAYLRLLPYNFIRYGLHTINSRENQPATIYVHPWEIDYLQPSIQVDWLSHVRQTWGTNSMQTKLHKLLSSSRFSTIEEVYARHLLKPLPAFKAVAPLARVS